MEPSKNQIRSLLLYEFQLGHGATEATKNVCAALGEGVVNLRTTQNWFAKFRSGDLGIEDQPRSGRPREIDRDALLEHVEANPTKSTRMLAADFGCSHTQIIEILHELGKTWRCSKWVPHDLTPGQRQLRVNIATELLLRHQQRPFLEKILTSDVKWIPLDNIHPEKQWLTPGQEAVPVPKIDQRQKKVLLCVWWHRGGIIHFEVHPNATIVNAELYCQQLDRVPQELRRGTSGWQRRITPIFLHDNARPHIAQMTRQKLEELQWEILPHPPYSPDLAPSDYHLFRSLEHSLRGHSFDNLDEVVQHLDGFFASKSKEFYARGIDQLVEKWEKTVENNGAYFD